MAKEYYARKNSPALSPNIIGYSVSKDAQEYLAEMKKGIAEEYRNFKKQA